MKRLAMACALAAAMVASLATSAYADCRLQALAVIPITFVNDSPMVEVSLNGKPALLRFGWSYYPMLWDSAVPKFKLDAMRSSGDTAYGPGGQTLFGSANVADLKVGGATLKDIVFRLVEQDQNVEEAGLYGLALAGLQDNYPSYDIEFDFPHSTVRVFKPQGCKGGEIVYWGGNFSSVDLDLRDRFDVHIGDKVLHGSLSPGDEVTFITKEGAFRTDLNLQAAGKLPTGMLDSGVLKPIDVSIARLPDLTLGDETIKHAALAVGDIFSNNHREYTGSRVDVAVIDRPEVIVGSDFARSHRIYWASGERKMYFAYQGGPVFTNIYKRLGADPPTPPALPAPKP